MDPNEQDVKLPPSDNYDSETPAAIAGEGGRARSSTSDFENFFGADIAVYLGVTFACGFVVMCQAASLLSQETTQAGNGKIEYAVAVGVIGMLLCVALFLIDRRGDSFNPKMKSFLAVFHCLWWGSASWLTYTQPYDGLGTYGLGTFAASYFAIWLAVVNSTLHALVASPDLSMLAGKAKGAYNVMSTGKKMTTVILVASFVEMISASVFCTDRPGRPCTKEYGYAVALGVISLFVSGAALFLNARLKPFMKFISGFLLLWWGIGSMIVCAIFDTDGPFQAAGNGFFASFAALAASAALFANALSDSSGGLNEPDDTAEATV